MNEFKNFELGIEQPQVMSVRELFNSKKLFTIPNYQRNFAWEEDEIKDFISDLDCSIVNKKNSENPKHFLGGILSIREKDLRVGLDYRYVLVDGQQRITLFYLSISSLTDAFAEVGKLTSDVDLKIYIAKTIEKIKNEILMIDVRDGIKYSSIRRLNVVERNRIFFETMLNNEIEEKKEFSDIAHVNLTRAFSMISNFIKSKLVDLDLNQKTNELNTIMESLLDEFMVLHFVSENEKSAYSFFKVLNDRGKNLSYIDLIKAEIMEMCSIDDKIMTDIECQWNYLMSLNNSFLEGCFSVIYNCYTGNQLSKQKEYDLIREHIFRNLNLSDNFTLVDLNKLMREIVKDVQVLVVLSDGKLPYDKLINVELYQYRYNLLINKLRNTASLTLFLAVYKKCNYNEFKEIINLVEKFFFRYRIICNGHAQSLKIMYSKAANMLHTDKKYADVKGYIIAEMKRLIERSAKDTLFTQYLNEMEYNTSNKKYIKYMLVYINYYAQSYQNGDKNLKIFDSTQIFDFDALTIEHIYNKSVPEKDKVAALEGVKNNIMNLTLLSPHDNAKRANTEDFNQKKAVYKDSTFYITREDAKIPDLNINEIEKRKDRINNIVLKLFAI